MNKYCISKVKSNFSRIVESLEEKEEEYIIISKYNKPLLKITLVDDNQRANLIGCAKGTFKIPDNFDDIDISADFSNELFPR